MLRKIAVLPLMLLVFRAGPVHAMEKPTAAEIAQYRADGSLASRIARAHALGNDQTDPGLLSVLRERVERLRVMRRNDLGLDQVEPVFPFGIRPRLASKGTNRIFALLIQFPDYPSKTPAGTIDAGLFGDGDAARFPYESLRNYYRRSSYGMLDLRGTTLGWYQPPYSRDSMAQTTAARQALIAEALNYFDGQGHDFSQYDNNNDGTIDYFCVFWTGPDNGWANFWWGYDTSFQSSLVIDGKQFRSATYSWQWETRGTSPFTPLTPIHETGHALGLPDLYDYDSTVGPRGGVGGLDMMDANWGDHNCFSKMLLDWISPAVATSGSRTYTLRPSATTQDALIVWPTYTSSTPFGEFFMVQNRYRVGNDTRFAGDGLIVWHIDATLNAGGGFYYNNSYASHKLVRLMEADGQEHVEQSRTGHAADLYTAGSRLAPDSWPNSNAYSGTPTNIRLDGIALTGENATFNLAFAGWTLQIAVNNLVLGATAPPPGAYSYGTGSAAQVSATPAAFCTFLGWSGDASGRTTPISVIMDRDRAITATFARVNAPANLAAVLLINRSVTQSERIVDLTWSPNPANAGVTIVAVRVYRRSGSIWTRIAELRTSVTTWRDRKVAKGTQQYGVTCVADDGVESDKAIVAVQ